MASRADSAKGHLISRQQDAAMISVQSGPESLWLHSRGYHGGPLPAETQSCWDILGSVQIAEGWSRMGRDGIRAQRLRMISFECKDWEEGCCFFFKVQNVSSAVKNSSKKLFQMSIKQHICPGVTLCWIFLNVLGGNKSKAVSEGGANTWHSSEGGDTRKDTIFLMCLRTVWIKLRK